MTTMSSLTTDPFLLEITTSTSTTTPHCDCVGQMSYHGADILCSNHTQCTNEQNLYRVCIGCMKRYCNVCFNDVHQHPLLAGCHSISWLSYTNSLAMFQRLGTPDHNGSLTMTVETIIQQHKPFYKKQKSAKHALSIMRQLKDKYSGTYTLTFFEYLRQYTQSTALFFTPVDVTEQRRFHSLGPCGRFFYRASKRQCDFNFLCFHHLLRKIRANQGENVGTVMQMMYHVLLLNFIGIFIYALVLLLPWLLSSTIRQSVTNSFSSFNWVGLTTGVGIDTLPIGYGGFPDPDWAPNQPSLHHFIILFPIYIFIIFAIATIYIFHLIIQNRQSLSETLSSPALSGSVSTTAFTIFEHRLCAKSNSMASQATQNFEANLRMSLIKKYNPDQKQSKCQKFCARNIFLMIISLLIIIGAAVGLFFIDHYGLSDTYGQRYLKLGINFQQLIFPTIFWVIKYLTERISLGLVKCEIPKKVQLYNRFRSVLFYRLSFLNICFLISLIVISYFHMNDTEPYYGAINYQRQIDLGYCPTQQTCLCPAQILGMFWYRILIVGFYFEFVMLLLSIIRAIFSPCCSKNPTFLFSPIPRLTQFYFTQSLVWASIIYLPSSVIIGFLTMLFGWFFTYFKIQVLKRKPMSGVYLLPSKIQFYFIFILLILISYIPSAILLSQYPNCGPYVAATSRGLNALGLFTAASSDFPVVVKEIFSYATNPLVLWLIIITGVTAIISLSQMATIGKKDRNKLLSRLKLESHERALLIKRLGVDYETEDQKGEELFIQWMLKTINTPINISNSTNSYQDNSKRLFSQYLTKIQRKHPNLIQLSKHSEKQLSDIFTSCGCPQHVADLLVRSFMEFCRTYRNQLVLTRQRVI